MAIGQNDTFQALFIIPHGDHGCLQTKMHIESYPDSFVTQMNLDSQSDIDSSLCETEIGGDYGWPIRILVIENLLPGWSYWISDTIFTQVGTLFIGVIPAPDARPGERGSVTAVGIDTMAIEIGSVTCEYIVPAGGCQYVPGDINGNGTANGIDIVYGVNYLKGGPPPPIDCYPICQIEPDPFYAAGDVNGNCAFNGIDITFFVRYLKGLEPSLRHCLDCHP
jgi:hypothetical protein